MGAPRYRGLVYDSARWDDFRLRPGDIVVSTPPKSGTTWTQMISALLVFQDPDLPARLPVLSPWIDQVSRSRKQLFEALEAQTHRRFVKTHTPLDGLPHDPAVTYLCVGRDPRDVAVSMDNHMANLDIAVFAQARAEAAAIDGIELDPLPQPPSPSPDPAVRFWRWVDDDTDPTVSGSTLRFTLTHLQGCADPPAGLDVVLLHYDDLQADLRGSCAASQPGSRSRSTSAAGRCSSRPRPSLRCAPGQPQPSRVRSADQWRIPSASSTRARAASGGTCSTTPASSATPRGCSSIASDDLSDWVHRGPLLS